MTKKEINGTIYIITNIKNNKSYVGQTTRDPLFRYREHFEFNTKNDDFHKELRANPDNFTFRILKTNIPNKNMLNQFEYYYIGLYNSKECGYNKSFGGTLSASLDNMYIPNDTLYS